jgi:phosphate transport system permease protein
VSRHSAFFTEIAPGSRAPLGTRIELLAAIPSIIYGIWGSCIRAVYGRAAAADRHRRPYSDFGARLRANGTGIFTAGFILLVMIIPFIASVMRATFEDIVPPVLKESATVRRDQWEVV